MSYYQPPLGPYPAASPYMPQPMSAYPSAYPVSPYGPYAAGVAPPYPAYPTVYPPTYPYALQPSFPQPYPPTPYHAQQYQHQHQHQHHAAAAAAAAAGQQQLASVYAQPPPTPAPPTLGVPAPAPAAVAVSSMALQVDTQGLPIVPGDPALQYAATYRVEEKVVSATRDSFTIRDQQGAVSYRVDGKFSLHEWKVLKDAHGQALLKLREARLKMRDQITIFNTSNVALLTLQKTAAIQIGSKRVHGYLGGHPSGAPVVIITGNFNNTHFRVANAQNEEIADIRRKKFSIKNMLTDQDTYEVTIQKGSPALVCFICVALDEIYED